MLNELAVLKRRRLEFLLAVACFGFIVGEASAQESVASNQATKVAGFSGTFDNIEKPPCNKNKPTRCPNQDNPANTVSVYFPKKNYTVTEGRNIQVKVRLCKRSSKLVKIDLTASEDGKATKGDYKRIPKKITFKKGELETTFTVVALEDKEIEDGESITFRFGSRLPRRIVAGCPAAATVKIIDAPANPARDVLEALRARVTGGAAFFSGTTKIVQGKEENTVTFKTPQFGQASPYLAFEAQPSVAAWRRNDSGDYHHISLEPLVNVRLTTIPVRGAGTSTSTIEIIQAPEASFLQSQKVAQVQLGAFGSINFGGFGVNGTRFHWAVGPTYRSMFQSVTDEQRAWRIWNIDDDLYDAWVVGVRLALNERSESSRGWMPTAYIDISRGKFQNFEFARPRWTSEKDKCSMENTNGRTCAKMCLEMPLKCITNPPPEDAFITEKKCRTYIEGRIFFKSIYLGFDLNNGDGYDDLRFSAGVTFKLNTFFPDRD